MYWLDSSPTQSIQQANLDGTEISVVVNTSSSSTLVFTLDVDNDRIYWIDKDNGEIMYSDLQGNNQMQLLSGSFDSRTIAAYGNINNPRKPLNYFVIYLFINNRYFIFFA